MMFEDTTKLPDRTSTPRSEENLSDATIFTIRLYGSLSVAFVFFLGTAAWCYCRKRRSIRLPRLPDDIVDNYNMYDRKTWLESMTGSYGCKHCLLDEATSKPNNKCIKDCNGQHADIKSLDITFPDQFNTDYSNKNNLTLKSIDRFEVMVPRANHCKTTWSSECVNCLQLNKTHPFEALENHKNKHDIYCLSNYIIHGRERCASENNKFYTESYPDGKFQRTKSDSCKLYIGSCNRYHQPQYYENNTSNIFLKKKFFPPVHFYNPPHKNCDQSLLKYMELAKKQGESYV